METAALVIGRAPGTLYNKVDPATDTGLFLEEAIQLINASQDYRILHAFAAACDHVAVPVCERDDWSDLELLELILQDMQAAGESAGAIRKALDDGRIDTFELRTIRDLFYSEIACKLELLSRLESLAHAA